MDEELLVSAISDDYKDSIVDQFVDDRTIILNEYINDSLLEKICLQILLWNKEDINVIPEKRKKIKIFISSNGGDSVMGNQILSSIKTSITPIITIGFSKCASMASYILASGTERYCFQNTIVLYHDGQTGYVSSSNKGKDIQKFYDKLDEYLTNFMVDNTDMTHEFLEEIKDREYYMFPEEAKELGIVDKIIGVDCDINEILE